MPSGRHLLIVAGLGAFGAGHVFLMAAAEGEPTPNMSIGTQPFAGAVSVDRHAGRPVAGSITESSESA